VALPSGWNVLQHFWFNSSVAHRWGFTRRENDRLLK
jgi:hypothetical protein